MRGRQIVKPRLWIGLVAAALIVASLGCDVALLNDTGSPTIAAATLVIPTPLPAGVIDQADNQDTVLVNLYERVSPSVVNVDVSVKDQTGQLQDAGLGSGFVYDSKGYIVTNSHVEIAADELRVAFADGTVLPAKVVGDDKYADLAVLKVEPPAGYTLNALEVGDSSTLKVGQRVVAIGNPFGLSNTMTVGIISGIGRTLPSNVTTDTGGAFNNPSIIQIDAAINPGNSGGPLLDLHGRVIGVNVAIRSETGVNSGIGFAIPSNTVQRVVPQIIQTGKVAYPYLGIAAQSQFQMGELALAFNLPVNEGVLITSVEPGSAAEKAGLRGGDHTETLRGVDVRLGGDIIIAVDKTPVRNFNELLAYLVSNTSVGQRVVITIIRDGSKRDIPVTLGERPPSQ